MSINMSTTEYNTTIVITNELNFNALWSWIRKHVPLIHWNLFKGGRCLANDVFEIVMFTSGSGKGKELSEQEKAIRQNFVMQALGLGCHDVATMTIGENGVSGEYYQPGKTTQLVEDGVVLKAYEGNRKENLIAIADGILKITEEDGLDLRTDQIHNIRGWMEQVKIIAGEYPAHEDKLVKVADAILEELDNYEAAREVACFDACVTSLQENCEVLKKIAMGL